MNHSLNNFNNLQNQIMKHESINFHEQLLQKIEVFQAELPNSIHLIKKTFDMVKKEVSAMNEWQNNHNFIDEEEEIHFLKTIRPSIISQFLYYQSLYNWESKAPLTDAELAVYYNEKHVDVKTKLEKLSYVKTYIKSEENKLFSIHNKTNGQTCVSESDRKNWRPCLQHCIPLAEYMSYELQLDYLKIKYSMYKKPIDSHKTKIPWNRNLVDFSEILFGLYHLGVFGDMSLKEIAIKLESIFDVEISQDLVKRWRDIAKRKQEPARFLNELAEVLKRQILNS